jgi:hypothetical protein
VISSKLSIGNTNRKRSGPGSTIWERVSTLDVGRAQLGAALIRAEKDSDQRARPGQLDLGHVLQTIELVERRVLQEVNLAVQQRRQVSLRVGLIAAGAVLKVVAQSDRQRAAGARGNGIGIKAFGL